MSGIRRVLSLFAGLALTGCMVQGPATANVDEEITFTFPIGDLIAQAAGGELPETFACTELPQSFVPPPVVTYALETAQGSTVGTAPLNPWATKFVATQAITNTSLVSCYELPSEIVGGSFSFTLTAPTEGHHPLFFASAITGGDSESPELGYFPVGRRIAVPGPAYALDNWYAVTAPAEQPIVVLAYANQKFYAAGGVTFYTSVTGASYQFAFTVPVDSPQGLVVGDGKLLTWGANLADDKTDLVLGSEGAFETVYQTDWEVLGAMYGNGSFVSLIDSDTILQFTSAADLHTYAVTDATLVAGAFGRGRFVVAAKEDADYNTRVYTSENGRDWTYSLVVPDAEPISLAYAAGVFLLVDNLNRHYRSLDGATWLPFNRYLDTPELARLEENSVAIILTLPPIPGLGAGLSNTNGHFVQQLFGGLRTSYDGLRWQTFLHGVSMPMPMLGRDGNLLMSSMVLEGVLQLPLYAVHLPLSLDTSFHNFGAIPVAGEAVKTVVLSNTSDQDITLAAATIDAPFAIQTDACSGTTLMAGDTCNMSIAFSPTTGGVVEGVVRIATSGPMLAEAGARFEAKGTPLAPPNAAPTAPALVSPENKATIAGPDVQLIWKQSTDPDGDAVTYDVYVCEAEDFGGCEPVASKLASMILPTAGTLGGLLFFGFSFRKRRGSAVLLLTLLTLGFVACDSNELKKAMTNSVEEEEPQGDIRELLAGEKAFIAKGLKAGTTYYWKVVAKDGAGGESTSEVRSFMKQ